MENFLADQDSFDDEYINAYYDEIQTHEMPTFLGYTLNDSGNAGRLYELTSTDLKFCGFWHLWSGVRWERDLLFRALELTRFVPEMLLRQALSLDVDDESAENKEKIDNHGETSTATDKKENNDADP